MKLDTMPKLFGKGLLALALSTTPLLAQTGPGTSPGGTGTTGMTGEMNMNRDDNDRDWGWLGLLGLAGLAGLLRRRDVPAERTSPNMGTAHR
jgi:MYXO-CTERM domain-containing protein